MFAGGAFGALTRAVLIELFPADASTWTVLAINLVGSFAFAWLTTALLAKRPKTMLLLGTGLIGGFTTYSTLALDVASRILTGDLGGFLLGLLSLAGGIALARLGWQLGKMGRNEQQGPTSPPTVPGGTAVAP